MHDCKLPRFYNDTARFQLHEMPLQSCHIYKHVIDRRISLTLDKSACVSYLLTTFLLQHLLSSSPCCLCKLCGARRRLSAPLLFGSGLISTNMYSATWRVWQGWALWPRVMHWQRSGPEYGGWGEWDKKAHVAWGKRNMKRTIEKKKEDPQGHICPIWGKFGRMWYFCLRYNSTKAHIEAETVCWHFQLGTSKGHISKYSYLNTSCHAIFGENEMAQGLASTSMTRLAHYCGNFAACWS